MEWLSQVSAFSIFLAIAGVGFVFLLLSLVFGEIFDHLGGGFEHDFDHGGPGLLSTRILSVFITAFGGFGAVATHYGLTPLPASGVGFGSGVGFALIIYAFARFLWGQQASTDVRTADLVGRNARVIVGIPAQGVGQIRCRIGEELVDKIARSRDGKAIPENAVVAIEEVLGDTVVVQQQ
jgi:membrane protein implicated in regulation of membrane protease activity